jgi:hypothetical protein
MVSSFRRTHATLYLPALPPYKTFCKHRSFEVTPIYFFVPIISDTNFATVRDLYIGSESSKHPILQSFDISVWY